MTNNYGRRERQLRNLYRTLGLKLPTVLGELDAHLHRIYRIRAMIALRIGWYNYQREIQR